MVNNMYRINEEFRLTRLFLWNEDYRKFIITIF